MTPSFGTHRATTEVRPCRVLLTEALDCRELRSTDMTDLAVLCTAIARRTTMYQAQHLELARQNVEQRLRPQKVQGIRRGARLIQLEIRRSRRSGHQK